jgi:Kdo2-lipid IVA lauroyltransferase/acyltransferase
MPETTLEITDLSPSRDVRQGGVWTRLQGWKNGVLWLLVNGVLAVLSPLSVVALTRVGQALGALVFRVGGAHRLTAEENLARVFPELPRGERVALTARVYRRLGALLGETVALLGNARRLDVILFEAGSREVLDAALACGGGVVFASAHLGPWERVAASLVRHGYPLTTIAREPYDPRFASLYDRLRGGAGVRVIYRGDPSAATRLVRCLRQGGLLGVPMDLASRVPSISVPLLGHVARTPVGPARVALRTGAKVVVGTVVPGGTTDQPLCIRVTALDTQDLATGAVGEQALTRRINDELSRRILLSPDAWPWMHPRWGGVRPDDSASSASQTR